MRPGKLNRRLKAAYESRNRADGQHDEHAAHLEEQLRVRYRSLYAHGRLQMLLTPRTLLGRTLLASTLTVFFAIAACEMPTSHTVEMGKRVHIEYTAPTGAAMQAGAFEPRKLIEAIATVADVDNVNVNATDTGVVVDVVAWGQDLDRESLVQLVQQQMGTQEGVRVEVDDLSGTVREPLRERLGRAMFHFEVDGQDAETIRAQILTQLAEQGYGDGANVQVDVQDGMTTINIEAQKPGADGSTEAAEEIVIERVDQQK